MMLLEPSPTAENRERKQVTLASAPYLLSYTGPTSAPGYHHLRRLPFEQVCLTSFPSCHQLQHFNKLFFCVGLQTPCPKRDRIPLLDPEYFRFLGKRNSLRSELLSKKSINGCHLICSKEEVVVASDTKVKAPEFEVWSEVACMPCKDLFHSLWLGKSHFCPNCRFEMPVD